MTIVIDIYWVHPSLVLPSTSIELGSYHIPIHLYRIIIRRKGFYSIDDTVRNNNKVYNNNINNNKNSNNSNNDMIDTISNNNNRDED